jgi:hypothetical protein
MQNRARTGSTRQYSTSRQYESCGVRPFV